MLLQHFSLEGTGSSIKYKKQIFGFHTTGAQN